MNLKLHFTPLAGPAWSLDLEHCLPISILDRKPWVDEGAVLFDVTHHSPGWRLYLHLLQAAEAAPPLTAKGPLHVNHLGYKNTAINYASLGKTLTIIVLKMCYSVTTIDHTPTNYRQSCVFLKLLKNTNQW